MINFVEMNEVLGRRVREAEIILQLKPIIENAAQISLQIEALVAKKAEAEADVAKQQAVVDAATERTGESLRKLAEQMALTIAQEERRVAESRAKVEAFHDAKLAQVQAEIVRLSAMLEDVSGKVAIAQAELATANEKAGQAEDRAQQAERRLAEALRRGGSIFNAAEA